MSDARDFRLVDTPDALVSLCAELKGAPWLALDTEFLRERTFYPKLCLLQVATPAVVACVDPLALADLTPLLALLYDPTIIKVMHAARQDLEIFYHLRGALPSPAFDTQLAAPLLGYSEQAGYAALVEALLGIHLSKSHTRADWSHRPLPAAQLHYAADDVRYLAELYPRLRDELHRLGRLEWLNEDFAALTDPAQYERPPEQAWLRVKGFQMLRGRRLAALQLLAAWRERTARAIDQPRNWLLKDETLLDLAKMQPADQASLLRIRSLNHQTVNRYGVALLEAIAASQGREPEPLPEEHRPPRLSTAQETVVELLSATLRMIGERQSLHPSAIASRKELERMAQGDRELGVLQGWRRKLAGETLLSVLSGDAALKVCGGTVQLVAGA